jgi:predicted PurR-regulated permease PerM
MPADRGQRVMLGVCTGVLVAAALYAGQSVLAPTAFALLIIALVWPMQRALEAHMPRGIALVVTVLATIALTGALVLLVAWGFGRVGQWLVANTARLQALYLARTAWLESHGVEVAGLLSEHFDIRWLVGAFQTLTGTLGSFFTFAAIALILTLLGLLEVTTVRDRLAAMALTSTTAAATLAACIALAAKLRRYMLVRTAMSLLTGVAIWAFARAVGLELATEWGVIAFVLNYIPVIGPLLATTLPTVFAILQFESWEIAVIVFVVLNLIQFVVGSYLEPRVAGVALAISPFVVLVAVFAWSALWGIPGAFIGVPMVIAALCFCQQSPASRWVADLLSGRAQSEPTVPGA